jgi:hypothetical protein
MGRGFKTPWVGRSIYHGTPYPWYFYPPTHAILTPLPMVYQTPSYGIMNSSLLVEMRGDSIYHEGDQNTMIKN